MHVETDSSAAAPDLAAVVVEKQGKEEVRCVSAEEPIRRSAGGPSAPAVQSPLHYAAASSSSSSTAATNLRPEKSLERSERFNALVYPSADGSASSSAVVEEAKSHSETVGSNTNNKNYDNDNDNSTKNAAMQLLFVDRLESGRDATQVATKVALPKCPGSTNRQPTRQGQTVSRRPRRRIDVWCWPSHPPMPPPRHDPAPPPMPRRDITRQSAMQQ